MAPNSFVIKDGVEDDGDDDNLRPKMIVDYDIDDSGDSNAESDDPPIPGMPPLLTQNDDDDDTDDAVIVEGVLDGVEDDANVTPEMETEQLDRGVRTRTTEVP